MVGRAWLAGRLRAAGYRTIVVAGVLAVAGCHATVKFQAAPVISGPKSPSPELSGPTSSGRAPSAGSSGLVRIHDPRQVTGTLTGPCHYRDRGQMPDPRCTPGSIDPDVTQANISKTICVSGYTRTVRPPESQTERFKYDVAYPDYGTPRGDKTELDHLVSLELGGSNDAANLWPEYPPVPNPKDKVENALHRAVCDGQVTLAAAQRAIAHNWMTAESVLGIK